MEEWRVALALASAGYSVYAALTDSGVYRWLTELQTRWFGGHEPMWTMIILLIGGTIAATLVSFIVARVFGPSSRGEWAPMSERTGSLLALLAALAFVIAAGTMGWLAAEISARPVIYELFDLGRRERAHGTYVELIGIEQPGLGLRVERGTMVTQYMPFTAPDWRPDEPVTYFLRNGAASPTPTPTAMPFGRKHSRPTGVKRRGALLEDDLPSAARAGFEKLGLKLAQPVFFIDAGKYSASYRYVLGAFACGCLALVCCIAVIIVRLQSRRYPLDLRAPPKTAP